MTLDTRQESYKKVGMGIPTKKTFLTPKQFWDLTREGWRFVVDTDGSILAYYPPSLSTRVKELSK